MEELMDLPVFVEALLRGFLAAGAVATLETQKKKKKNAEHTKINKG